MQKSKQQQLAELLKPSTAQMGYQFPVEKELL